PRAKRSQPQSHQREQGPPDFVDDADRTDEVRNADLQPVAGHALLQETDFAAGGAGALVEPRRAAGDDLPRRRHAAAAGSERADQRVETEQDMKQRLSAVRSRLSVKPKFVLPESR